ncbi:hypothetical protein GCM10012286_77750 [Streptomyces lasiicapitis]|uniref:Uncharacterized protein n=1 Tax=Streptomyces lasiicapitis TaxID=1923961 RepID=A0ABQ2MYT3_9ACTN|nr:hypothetical protein GCM10012286_77750 [Streptomyces lasiicapitis]
MIAQTQLTVRIPDVRAAPARHRRSARWGLNAAAAEEGGRRPPSNHRTRYLLLAATHRASAALAAPESMA